MQTGLEGRRKNNRIIISIAALAAVLAVSLCIGGYSYSLNSPAEVFMSIRVWIKLSLANLLNAGAGQGGAGNAGSMPFYGDVISRIKYTGMTFMCGMLMAVSGHIFQTVFRNPMAAPTMLGVSTGVNLGVLALVLQFGAAAYQMMSLKYIYCYSGAIAVLAAVLILGKISSGRKRTSVFDYLLVGAILSQIIGAVMTYFTYAMENDQMLIYQEISGDLHMDISNNAFEVLGVAMLIGLVPMFMIRFSFNAVSFETDDSRSMGVNAYALKIITMILGTIMIAAAMIHCGSAGMISLIAPFISRGLFGAEFRKSFWGDLLIGGGLLVICKDVTGLIPFGDSGLPLGTIVDFIAVPVFVLIVVSQRRIWE